MNREPTDDATESETLRMDGRSSRGNRETPATPTPVGDAGRLGKVVDQTPNMHVVGESDGLIVPRKQANKTGPTAVAEPVEGRGPAKGSTAKQATDRTQSRKIVLFGLHGVRKAARRDKRMRFTALLHHITPELLKASFLDLNRQAVAGIDDVTWRDYANGLEDRIADLHNRIHRGTYRAQPSKRTWIPKADGRQRPLGIAALVQVSRFLVRRFGAK
jgi:RNA-directed DNA polymerase